MIDGLKIAAVVPCYKTRTSAVDVVRRIPAEVDWILCVDDACPDATGDHIQETATDPRVRVIRHPANQGVGGAVLTGYRTALEEGADVVVKIDSDGQMDPDLLLSIANPVITGRADYAKGNRFYQLDHLEGMPPVRLVGNAGLSFLTKLSSGYWHVFDPTNGYTAIHRAALSLLPLDKIARGYFFESDMLFQLNLAHAVVEDVPMRSVYGVAKSHLSVARVFFPFLLGNLKNFAKRFFYRYLLRDFSYATVQAVLGTLLLLFGTAFGLFHWIKGSMAGQTASAGTVM
ncbi:MAG: glycosyltransferase family 2 protein, partial [Planctomycetota bacterium]